MKNFIPFGLGTYLKSIIQKWYIYLGFIPALADLLNFFFSLNLPKLPLWSNISLISILLIIATFTVWKKQWIENNNLKNKRPNFIVNFEDGKETKEINSVFIDKKLKKEVKEDKEDYEKTEDKIWQFKGIFDAVNNIALSMKNAKKLWTSMDFDPQKSKVIEEIKNEYIPIKILLKNTGNSPGTTVNVHISFPKEFNLLEELPKETNFSDIHYKPSHYGVILHKKDNVIQLWANKVVHPYTIEFPQFFISLKKSGRFNAKYTINTEQLPPDSIKGTLKFKSNPITETEFLESGNELKEEEEIKKIILDNLVEEE